MRMHLLSLVFAGLVAALAPSSVAVAGPSAEAEAAQAPVAVQRVAVPSRGLRDEAAMVLVGTALIGLAAVVRRAA
ncbi:MAG TPA: hypothetical protein VM364_20435 [Vicinamibacterales bacterium]|nr:hypothetical protein [Vicinamibacterales bacterium]